MGKLTDREEIAFVTMATTGKRFHQVWWLLREYPENCRWWGDHYMPPPPPRKMMGICFSCIFDFNTIFYLYFGSFLNPEASGKLTTIIVVESNKES